MNGKFLDMKMLDDLIWKDQNLGPSHCAVHKRDCEAKKRD